MAQKVKRTFGVTSEIVEFPPVITAIEEGRKSLFLSEKRGEKLSFCASMDSQYCCCGVQVLASVSQCPFECNYCVLQDYLNNHLLQVVADIPALLSEVQMRAEQNPKKLLRIGTWVLGDGLALEAITGSAEQLILGFAKIPNAILEIKTKSNVVDPILGLDHQEKTVMAWSLNPATIIARDEKSTATLERRIQAIEKTLTAGYPVALHFDPMIDYEDWEQGYFELIQSVAAVCPAGRIAWISIGSLRFNPEMKRSIDERFPQNQITCAEMILGSDGKIRYLKKRRIELYRKLYSMIRDKWGAEVYVYLCMERPEVWDAVMGSHPDSIAHQDYLIAKNLSSRFPSMMKTPELREPRWSEYEFACQ